MPNPRPLLALVLALVIAACGSTAPSSGATTSGSAAAPTAVPSDATPAVTAEPVETGDAPTAEPGETEPVESEEPGGSSTPSASPDASPGPAAACSGSDDNRRFYAGIAGAVAWTVLCPVLPRGWYVSAGSSSTAGGGRLAIGYKGPAGATLDLSEGAFCAEVTGCVPAGMDGDDVPLGPLTGTFVRLDDGGHAIVVDRGLAPSWLLVTHGVDEATTLAFGAGLAEVAAEG